MRKIQTILVLASICFTANSFAIGEAAYKKLQAAYKVEQIVSGILANSVGLREHLLYSYRALYCLGEARKTIRLELNNNPTPSEELRLRDEFADIQTAIDVADARVRAIQGNMEVIKIIKQTAEEKIREQERLEKNADTSVKIGILKEQIRQLPSLELTSMSKHRDEINELARQCGDN